MTRRVFVDRPARSFPAPAGYRWVAEVERTWTAAAAALAGWQCRAGAGYRGRDACGGPAVAMFYRGRGYGREPEQWAYCARHLFGRWVDGERVMVWRLKRQGEST